MKIDINENELDYTIQGMERESSLKKQTKVVQREDNAILSVQSWILRALTIWVGQLLTFNFNLLKDTPVQSQTIHKFLNTVLTTDS